MRAFPVMYVCRRKVSQFVSLFPLTAALLSEVGSDGSHMRLKNRAPVCMGGEGFYIYFSIAPAEVPFCPLFCSIPGSGYFLDSMAVYVFAVCIFVSMWLRCGVAPLSLSLWIVAGMVVVWPYCRAVGEEQGPACN